MKRVNPHAAWINYSGHELRPQLPGLRMCSLYQTIAIRIFLYIYHFFTYLPTQNPNQFLFLAFSISSKNITTQTDDIAEYFK